MPRGAYVPPLLVVLRCGHLSAKLQLVRYTRRSFTGAAGVSPPWYGNHTRSTGRFLSNEDARMPRGAYAPPSWWSCDADICR